MAFAALLDANILHPIVLSISSCGSLRKVSIARSGAQKS